MSYIMLQAHSATRAICRLENGVMTNADMRVVDMRQFCELNEAGQYFIVKWRIVLGSKGSKRCKYDENKLTSN